MYKNLEKAYVDNIEEIKEFDDNKIYIIKNGGGIYTFNKNTRKLVLIGGSNTPSESINIDLNDNIK